MLLGAKGPNDSFYKDFKVNREARFSKTNNCNSEREILTGGIYKVLGDHSRPTVGREGPYPSPSTNYLPRP